MSTHRSKFKPPAKAAETDEAEPVMAKEPPPMIELRSADPERHGVLHLMREDWEAAGEPATIEEFHERRK